MSCEAINNYLATESGRLVNNTLYRRGALAQSPELALITREEYPREMGNDFRYITYERAAPTSILTWASANAYSADVAETDCGACANSFNAVDVGYTTRTATLYKHELKSRMLCVEDMKWAWGVKQQLDAVMSELQQYVKLSWEQKAKEDMFTFAQHKVVCNGTQKGNSTSTMATTYPAACATHILEQRLLDYWYARLYRDGAGAGALGMEGGAPVLPLLIGPEMSRSLLTQDSNGRTDINYGAPQELLKGIMASRVYRGFAHIITPFPRRFTCSGGTYTEVAPFASANKTILTGVELNSSWENAPYEEILIPNKRCFTHMVPRPISNPGGGTSFDPVSYTGEWVWNNVKGPNGENAFGSYGRFYGRMFVSPKPLDPYTSVTIVARRCAEAATALPSPCNYS